GDQVERVVTALKPRPVRRRERFWRRSAIKIFESKPQLELFLQQGCDSDYLYRVCAERQQVNIGIDGVQPQHARDAGGDALFYGAAARDKTYRLAGTLPGRLPGRLTGGLGKRTSIDLSVARQR